MKSTPLIKQLQEDGMGAADVAGAATPLFASMVRRSKRPKLTTKQYTNVVKKPSTRKMGVKETFLSGVANVKEAALDSNSVIARLKGLEKQEQSNNQPMATFGLEDEAGIMVKVSVPADQGQDFEKSLQAALTMDDDTTAEIAEILFDLKDRFDILNVEWGDVVEDEEEMPEVDPSSELQPGEPELPVEPENTEDVSSLLVQVIDMMKSDAEARSADAKARRAEAEAKEAVSTSHEAAARVRQEEQILDMEAAESKEKDIAKEAKRLAKLAKWRHGMSDNNNDISDMDDMIPSYNATGQQDAPVSDIGDEDEEMQPVTTNLATLLLNKLGKR